jgi:hypothetical protein
MSLRLRLHNKVRHKQRPILCERSESVPRTTPKHCNRRALAVMHCRPSHLNTLYYLVEGGRSAGHTRATRRRIDDSALPLEDSWTSPAYDGNNSAIETASAAVRPPASVLSCPVRKCSGGRDVRTDFIAMERSLRAMNWTTRFECSRRRPIITIRNDTR